MSARFVLALTASIAAVGGVTPAPAAQLQACPGNCAVVTAGSGSGRRGDAVRIPLGLAQAPGDVVAGGADEVAALVFTVGVPGLELENCEHLTADGLTDAVEVPPAVAAGYRVVIENTSCTDRSRCLCPEGGNQRDAFVNVVVFGPKDLPPGGGPVQIPSLPNGELLALHLRIGQTAPVTVPLHVFTEEDDQGEVPKPAFGALLSVGDTQSVDVTGNFATGVSKVTVVDGTVHVVTATCAGDCNSSGNVSAADVAKIVALVTDCPCVGSSGGVAAGCAAIPGSDKQCLPADLNHDGCITADELNTIVSNVVHSPSGCPNE